jgi:hypothetical protein
MSTAISDEPGLDAMDACWIEWNRCLRWERHHQNEHEEWLRENPAGNARILAIIGYWRERRVDLEAQLKELSQRSRIVMANS